MQRAALKGCSTVQKSLIEIVFEIVIEIGKPCSTMQKIVIEIVIVFFRTSSEKLLLESAKKSIIERTRLFSV